MNTTVVCLVKLRKSGVNFINVLRSHFFLHEIFDKAGTFLEKAAKTMFIQKKRAKKC